MKITYNQKLMLTQDKRMTAREAATKGESL
jgi:hypothetical protein